MAQAIIGAGVSLFTGMKSLQAQKKAQKAAQQAQETADRREQRKLLRQQAIIGGQVTNVAAQTGGLGSTAVEGGLSGLTNQVQSQVGFQTTTSMLAKQQSKYMAKAAQWNMIGDIGTSFVNALPSSSFSLGG